MKSYTTFIILVTILFVLYYAGNIIYDLLLKKETITATDESEEFTLSDFAEQNKEKVQGVEIEDVEYLKIPQSFITNSEAIIVKKDLPGEKLNQWREEFEAEENIDQYYAPIKEETIQSGSEKPGIKKTDWNKMLNLAETSVQVISNNNGHKVYQSTI
ncbi:hypothetical protein CMV00_02005 [Elizabethkingia anophelis]|nr:hypothetical protein [Elizabethkingia anophelis]